MINISNLAADRGFGKSTSVLNFFKEYYNLKEKNLNKLKGGINIMETKSRYEVIADLEEKKRELMISKDGLGDKKRVMERALKELNRQVEDQEEEIKNFETSMKEQEETYDALITSTDESLKRFSELNAKK